MGYTKTDRMYVIHTLDLLTEKPRFLSGSRMNEHLAVFRCGIGGSQHDPVNELRRKNFRAMGRNDPAKRKPPGRFQPWTYCSSGALWSKKSHTVLLILSPPNRQAAGVIKKHNAAFCMSGQKKGGNRPVLPSSNACPSDKGHSFAALAAR